MHFVKIIFKVMVVDIQLLDVVDSGLLLLRVLFCNYIFHSSKLNQRILFNFNIVRNERYLAVTIVVPL